VAEHPRRRRSHARVRVSHDFQITTQRRAEIVQTANELRDSDKPWFDFITAYGDVGEDGTLSARTDPNNQLLAVQHVRFAKGRNRIPSEGISFIVDWTIRLKDGRTLKTKVDVGSDGKAVLTSHHLALV